MQNEMITYILNCFDELITKYSLAVNIKRPLEAIFTIDLESKNDAMYICYSTHPSDFPFSFDIRYCKQKFIDKEFALYRHDTKEIISLWRFDRHLDTTINGSLKKDMSTISECCKIASEMFTYFQGMSDDEYCIASEKLKRS